MCHTLLSCVPLQTCSFSCPCMHALETLGRASRSVQAHEGHAGMHVAVSFMQLHSQLGSLSGHECMQVALHNNLRASFCSWLSNGGLWHLLEGNASGGDLESLYMFSFK